MEDIARLIRDIPDFPKKGIVFKDLTPFLRDRGAFARAIDALEARHRADRVAVVAAIESRGFIFGGAVAVRLGAGFVPIRKPGKLPYRTISETYSLEYGEDTLEVHEDAVRQGDRVLIVDDLLATGGTSQAAARLMRRMGAEVVGASFVVELAFLGGRARLDGLPVFALVRFD